MYCLQCGSQNPGSAARCIACGAPLDVNAPAVKPQPFLKKARERWAYTPAGLKGAASLILGLLAASTMRASLEQNGALSPLCAGALLAGLAFWLGVVTVRGAPAKGGSRPGRVLAVGGVAMAAGTLAAPVVALVVAVAMFPQRMVSEPMALSNLRRLSVAFQTYAEDHGGRYPGWVTDARGHPYHNVWDQQIAPYMPDEDAYRNTPFSRGIRSPSQPPPYTRVIGYGLNGLLLTRPKAAFDGNAIWASGPAPLGPDEVESPNTTIVLAEIATLEPVSKAYERVDRPGPRPPGRMTGAFYRAMDHWIDIDPRAWVETDGPEDSYLRNRWNGRKGVGRSLHAGGACYAFADGHVAYMRLRTTVTGGRPGLRPEDLWSPANASNMWRPRR